MIEFCATCPYCQRTDCPRLVPRGDPIQERANVRDCERHRPRITLYWRREDALRIALESGQCEADCLGAKLGELYSEDVW